MKKIVLLIFVFTLFGVFAHGQNSSASPQTTSTPSTASEDDVVKITTSVIQLDITVTDKKGNPLSDIRKEEIEIYENGKKQNIANMQYMRGVLPADKQTDFTVMGGTVRPENVRRTIAIVVDDLNLSFESTVWVKNALRKFIKEQIQDGDLVAVIRTGAGIGALQQFTTDRRQLMAAAERVRFRTVSGGGVFIPAQSMGKGVGSENTLDTDLAEFRESIFSAGTLGALNFIIRGMGELPGRKSVVLLSDGMPIFSRNTKGAPEASSILFRLRRLTDLANRASVVVSTIDAKGLEVPGFLMPSDSTSDMSADEVEQRLSKRSQAFIDSQEGLRYLANTTGGLAILNSNNIYRGMERIMNDQSYYLVGYEPDDDTFDVKTRRYNKLEVKVLRPGAQARYRSGFFGISDDNFQKTRFTGTQGLIHALTSPFAVNDIAVRSNSFFTADEKRDGFLRTYIHVPGNALTFTKNSDGTYRTVFDLVAMTFVDEGAVADQHAQTYTVTLGEDAMRQVAEKGFVYDFNFPIKKSGGFQMRVALRDNATNKIGSANQFVPIPNIKKNRLTLSGIVFESISLDDWAKVLANRVKYDEIKKVTDVRVDTALRQFKSGSVVRYGIDLYNVRVDGSGKSRLVQSVKLYKDGKEYFRSEDISISAHPASRLGVVTHTGTLKLGPSIPAGEYILEISITDELAKGSGKLANQIVSFDVVE